MFFWDTLRDLTFFNFMLAFCRKVRFWNPFKIQLAQKWDPKSIKWRQIAQQRSGQSKFYRYMFATCFSEALGAPPLHILDRFGLALGSLFDQFRTPFYLISLSIGLVLERRCRQSWVLWKWVGGTPEGITIYFESIWHCKIIFVRFHWNSGFRVKAVDRDFCFMPKKVFFLTLLLKIDHNW